MTQPEIKKIQILELTYLIYFAIMFGARAAGLYEGRLVYNISLVLGMLLFVVKVALTRHTVFEYLVMAALLGLSVIVYRNTGEKGLLLYMTMMLGMKGVSLKRVQKWALFILGTCFPVLVFLSVTGIIQDITFPAGERLFFGEALRRSLGYPHYNTLFTTYIVLVMLLMLVRGQRGKRSLITMSGFLFAVGIYVYYYSCSYTGLIVLVVYLGLNFVMQCIHELEKPTGIVIWLLYPACLIISALFPNLIVSDYYNRVYNSFRYSFAQIGVVACIVVTVIMMATITDLIKRDQRIELGVCISCLFLGLSDPFMFNLSYKNLMFLFAGELFFRLVQEYSDRLPAALNRGIVIFKGGESSFSYEKNPLYIFMTKTRVFFYRIFDDRGLRHVLGFFLVTLVVYGLSYNLMDYSIIDGAVDGADEWEYVRTCFTIGIWTGSVTMAFVAGRYILECRKRAIEGKKNLLIYAHYYYPDVASTGQILTDLAQGLVKTFKVTVICTVPSYTGVIEDKYKTRLFYREDIDGVEVLRVRVPEFDKTVSSSRIKNILSYFFMAVFATHMVGPQDYIYTISQPPILGGLIGRFGKFIKGGKLIYNIQDFNPEQVIAVSFTKNRLTLGLMMLEDKLTCRAADKVIVVGRDMVDTLKKRFRRRLPKYTCINNWIDEKDIVPLPADNEKVVAFKEKYGLRDKFIIMYSGNIGLYYDLLEIQKIIAKFDGEEDVVFAFVGQGSVLEAMKAYSREHDQKNIVYIPYQNKEDLVYSLNAGDVHFVVNSKGIKGVSVPSKIYGVMAAGKPVLGILEEGTEARMLIEDSGCGTVAEPGDYKAIEESIRYYIDNKDSERLREMGMAGRRFLDEGLTKDASISKYAEVIDSL